VGALPGLQSAEHNGAHLFFRRRRAREEFPLGSALRYEHFDTGNSGDALQCSNLQKSGPQWAINQVHNDATV